MSDLAVIKLSNLEALYTVWCYYSLCLLPFLRTNTRSRVLRLVQYLTGLTTLYDFTKKAHDIGYLTFANRKDEESFRIALRCDEKDQGFAVPG